MKNTFNIIKNESLEIIKTIKGKSLKGISIDYGDQLNHTLSQMVVLHMENDTVSFWTTEIENRPDEYPDLAEITVQKETEEHLKFLTERLVRFDICQKIVSIEEIIEHVTITEPEEQPFILTNTKAIIIHFDEKKLIMEKDCYWFECWSVTLLPKGEDYTFYDEWKEKADDDPATYQVTMEHQFI